MGKSGLFKKAKNDGESRSSKSNKKKKKCSRVYIKVELAWLL
jgi:hypothetical protein